MTIRNAPCLLWCLATLLMCCANTRAQRKLPENFNLKEAVKKTHEIQATQREKRRRQEVRNKEREKAGLPPEEDTKDMWTRLLNEEDTEGKATGHHQGFNRTVDPKLYIVTGTTPQLEVAEDEPKRGTLLASKQPPFVHWVCYRGAETNLEDMATEQLACCQEFFRAMEQAPEGLCWKADVKSCGSGPDGLDLSKPLDIGVHMGLTEEQEKQKQILATSKAEFMAHCTHQIARVPSDSEIDSPASAAAMEARKSFGVPPRWSLVVAPVVMAKKPTDKWKQFILVQDGNFGTWIKSAPSPTHPARPLRVAKMNEQIDTVPNDVRRTEGVFGAKLVSRLVENEQDDEFRDFTHTLTLDLHKIVRISEDETYTMDFTVLFPLPNELRLPKPRKGETVEDRALSACRSNCGSPSCQLSIVQAQMKKSKKASVWGQQSVVAVKVHIDNLVASENVHEHCKFSWRTTMWLEDEEPLLVSQPLLQDGVLKRRGGDGEQYTLLWDAMSNPSAPLLTDLEERERLEDLWKVEL